MGANARGRSTSFVLASTLALAACEKSSIRTDARDAAPAKAAFVPAPDSSLARELGADDAGRGEYRFFDDGPWCGLAPRVDRKKPLGAAVTKEPSSLMGPLESGPIGFYETEKAPPDGPRADGDVGAVSAARLVLVGPKRVAAGETIALAQSLTLVNAARTPFRYAVAVDGGFEHWRSPFVDLYARDEGSGRTYRWTHGESFGRCGNVNSRKPADFVLLAPGKRKADPFGEWSRTSLTAVVDTPGRYTLWVVYAVCAGAERGLPLATDDPSPADLFEGTIASNAIALEVVPHAN